MQHMAEEPCNPIDLNQLAQADLDITGLADEIRADRLCLAMLRTFFNHLTAKREVSPEQAGSLCHGADYFLREFIIGDRRENLLQVTAERVEQFAGHWYIVRTLEPNMAELGSILTGIAAFYRFLADHGLVDRLQAEAIAAACAERDAYRQRIDDFWAIEADGFLAWRDEIPL